MRRFTGHSEPWGSFVDVKVNASEVLGRQLERTHIKGPVLIGSVCDAYQPIEKRYGLTRACIQQLVTHEVSFSVLTKSSLVLRDLDILTQAGDTATVGISLSILDESIRRIFEPGASRVQDRLNTLEELHKNGVRTYVFIGPILPTITNPQDIVAAAGAFVDEVWGEALNIRCGNREDLTRAFATCNLSDEWQTLVRSEEYWNEMARRLEQACRTAKRTLVGFYRH
jgi:DNA repair photolyase